MMYVRRGVDALLEHATGLRKEEEFRSAWSEQSVKMEAFLFSIVCFTTL